MPADRAGYTVTMFLIDLSPSMGNTRTVEISDSKGSDPILVEMTNLEWSIQFVKLKIQEMIFNGRKTDQCGVIVFGIPETSNVLNDQGQGYEHVYNYIPIDTPNAATLTKLDALRPTGVCGDPIDAIIVAIETQQIYLATKKTWTRRMVLLTDGESLLDLDEWESTARAINERNVIVTIIGVDFDDEELPFEEENKSEVKTENEAFYREFVAKLDNGVLGTCAHALQEIARPEVKVTKSVLMGSVLRIGDVNGRPDEAMEIMIKTSKCTALARPKSWKRFAKRGEEKSAEDGETKMEVDEDEAEQVLFAQLKMRSEYYLENKDENGEIKVKQEDGGEPVEEEQRLEKEELTRGFKYGSTYVPCPDGQFERLKTKKGIELLGFFNKKNFRRELAMSEVQYIWADPSSPNQQVALSSIVKGMASAKVMGIARWVSKDGMDPRMGVVTPCIFDKVDCLLWVQMPFADDVRKYTFASLERLFSKEGEEVTTHPYLPTETQLEAMDNLVDAIDLMDAGEKDEDGVRAPWFDNRESYNPSIHRVKQAMFHSAVVTDVVTNPVPPPHHELLKYFEAPKRVLKRSRDALEACKEEFKVKKVPKRIARARKDDHVHAQDEDEDMTLLDKAPLNMSSGAPISTQTQQVRSPAKKHDIQGNDSATEDEDEVEQGAPTIAEPAVKKPETPKRANHLPTPARSLSPAPEVDLEREPGRIVGSAFPLKDFKENIAQGDVVTKAVEDLAYVIREVIKKPFATRRFKEMVECMRELRELCLKEDEIEAWNEFMMDLREECIEEKPGNAAFWEEVKQEGRPMSLISKPEAAMSGGKSRISESVSAEFVQK